MERIKSAYIIHGMALLHALVALLCLLCGVNDAVLLTLLTMTLTVLICVKHYLPEEFTAINVILVNVVGFALGTLGSDFISLFTDNELIHRPMATLATTELLGWSLELFARYLEPVAVRLSSRNRPHRMGWLIFAVVTVFVLRIAVDEVFIKTDLFPGNEFTVRFTEFLSNSLVLILMLLLTFWLIRATRRGDIGNLYITSIVVVSCLACIAVMGALLQTRGIPFHYQNSFSSDTFLQNLFLACITEAVFYAVIYLFNYGIRIHDEVVTERERTHQAEFRYMALKQQVNPHFLFNSLNILDGLVQYSSREDASRYVHQLAGIYRYMLQHEGESLVSLQDEVEFARMYKELLEVRFPVGFGVEMDVREEDMQRKVVPCSLQLLIENATKHNAITEEEPLKVRIVSDGKTVTVSNNLVPRLSPSHSTGLGQKYIIQQYRDIGHRDVTILNDAGQYCVSVPLL